VLTRAIVLSRDNAILYYHISTFNNAQNGVPQKKNSFKSMEEMEKEHIIEALMTANNQKGKTCELLKISRPTLRKKIEKYNIRT
jgi:transcriptional regulator with PAS, ATPase and Fis domain